MPSIIILSPDQIADLYGAINENVGTGDGSTKIFQLDYYPVVVGRTIQDELAGVGDGVQTNYQLQYYPVTAGTLKLYRTAVATANLLTETTHYTVTLATGEVVLTNPAGLAFLGNEQLHAAYSVPSTLELHVGSISGPLLILATDYSVVAYSGKVTLTNDGVAALGTADLYAKYRTSRGLVNVLVESNASLRGTLSSNVILLEEYQNKDADIRDIHQTLETKAIIDASVPDRLGIEVERRWEFQPYSIVFVDVATSYVAATEEVTETRIVDSVTTPYDQAVPPANAPLYPAPPPLPGDVSNRQPDSGKPRYSYGLTGGNTTTWNANEEWWLSQEIAAYSIVQGAGPDTVPGRLARFNNFLFTMLPDINGTLNALNTYVIPSLQKFLFYNPTPNEYVTTGDIADAQAAFTNATAYVNDTAAWFVFVYDATHTGLGDSYINVPPRKSVV